MIVSKGSRFFLFRVGCTALLLLSFVPVASASRGDEGGAQREIFSVLRGAFRAKEGSKVVECRLENLSRISGEAGGDLLDKSIKPCEHDELSRLITEAPRRGEDTQVAVIPLGALVAGVGALTCFVGGMYGYDLWRLYQGTTQEIGRTHV